MLQLKLQLEIFSTTVDLIPPSDVFLSTEIVHPWEDGLPTDEFLPIKVFLSIAVCLPTDVFPSESLSAVELFTDLVLTVDVVPPDDESFGPEEFCCRDF